MTPLIEQLPTELARFKDVQALTRDSDYFEKNVVTITVSDGAHFNGQQFDICLNHVAMSGAMLVTIVKLGVSFKAYRNKYFESNKQLIDFLIGVL